MRSVLSRPRWRYDSRSSSTRARRAGLPCRTRWTYGSSANDLKYGLSDNGLRKIYKAMNIPLPFAGHWAKISAGYQVPKVPLPAESKFTSYTSQAPDRMKESFHLPADDLWLTKQDAHEDQTDGAISVEQSPFALGSCYHNEAMRVLRIEALTASP